MEMKEFVKRLENLLLIANAEIKISDEHRYEQRRLEIIITHNTVCRSIVDLESINVATLEKAYEELT